MISLYLEGNSQLHRLPTGFKMALLVVMATGMFVFPHLWLMLVFFIGTVICYFYSRLPYDNFYKLVKVTFWLLCMLFFFNAYAQGFTVALVAIIRVFTLLLMSTIISLTTRISEMMEVITRVLSPLQYVGIDVGKISLCMMLAIRFIPMLFEITQQVKEVQSIRGVCSHPFALIIPICVRVFKLANELTQALEARGFESMPSHKTEDKR